MDVKYFLRLTKGKIVFLFLYTVTFVLVMSAAFVVGTEIVQQLSDEYMMPISAGREYFGLLMGTVIFYVFGLIVLYLTACIVETQDRAKMKGGSYKRIAVVLAIGGILMYFFLSSLFSDLSPIIGTPIKSAILLPISMSVGFVVFLSGYLYLAKNYKENG